MPPDRKAIEKKDFPLTRRGYEPAAVDRHLRALAERFEAARSEPKTLASTASEQVQSIVAAAEASAAGIRSEAEAKARATAEIAERHAEQVRSAATRQAEEYVAKVREATTSMLERQQSIEAELTSLLKSVSSNGKRIDRELGDLTRGLDVLTHGLGELSADSADWRTDGSGKTRRLENAPEEDAETELEFDNEERARIVALDMALDGTSREEAGRLLSEKFTLEDPRRLLDETYSKFGREAD